MAYPENTLKNLDAVFMNYVLIRIKQIKSSMIMQYKTSKEGLDSKIRNQAIIGIAAVGIYIMIPFVPTTHHLMKGYTRSQIEEHNKRTIIDKGPSPYYSGKLLFEMQRPGRELAYLSFDKEYRQELVVKALNILKKLEK